MTPFPLRPASLADFGRALRAARQSQNLTLDELTAKTGISKPYLGNFISIPSDWTPLKERKHYFGKYSKPDLDPSDPWQFKNFLVTAED